VAAQRSGLLGGLPLRGSRGRQLRLGFLRALLRLAGLLTCRGVQLLERAQLPLRLPQLLSNST
jgi:hypothetical protein